MKRSIIIAVAVMLLPLVSGAQALKGSYFMDNSLNRNKMNPAFAPRANYLQIPVVGNLGMGAMTNLDVPTFLYPYEGELLTFLHKNVSVAEFDKALAQYPHFDMDMATNILNFGFYNKKKAFWTFDLSVRAGLDVDVPRDLFMFVKKGTGTSGESFNIANFNAYASASVQAALGWSRNVSDGVRIGVKARFIAPLAYAALNLENVRLSTSHEKWTVETEGYVYGALQGLDVNLPEGELMPEVSFDLNRMLANKVLAGYGGSVDLGVDWQIIRKGFFKGLSLSAAVTDLGVISYKQDALSAFSTAGKVDWVGFQDVSMDNMDIEAAINDFVESAKDQLINLTQEDMQGGMLRSSMPSVYAGLEVPILWNRISFGLLYSGRFSHSYYRQEVTASCNLMPLKWLALGLNYSMYNTRGTFGWLLELTPKAGVNICVGCDYLPGEWIPAPILDNMMQMPSSLANKGYEHALVPASLRTNFHFGLSLALGSKHGR
ncbi:MAG: hypothetical protein IKV05_02970 [Bacteroidales bacterium]|nr:hypothetical protein [Bacteroidales bacterium]